MAESSDHGPFEPISIVYQGHDRKLAQVEVDGAWCDAELRSWRRDESGAWSAFLMWSRGPGQDSYLGWFPSERVRPHPDDRP